ncbi:MAG: hypothetical protein ABSC08_12185, partial [Bryobacteraceae bacterium]
YIEPASDDAALRIANDLTSLGIHATFKVVGEKARVLDRRGRKDVIAALSRHAIGYHSNWHSVHPTPSEYLSHMGFLEGAEEFERREALGAADVFGVFGKLPVCYGQPGSSWGPQSNLALRRIGIPVYLDEGEQVGLDEQPFWYGGLLYVFNMGRNTFRAELNVGAEDKAAYARFDEAVKRLAPTGGVISIYYHPTEFVTTEFWDAVNFAHGANPERSAWVKPRRRTPAESERCYGVLHHFVEHMKRVPGVSFVGADELPGLFENPLLFLVDRSAVAAHLSRHIVFGEFDGEVLSPADMLLALLNVGPATVDGPTAAAATTYSKPAIPAAAFERAREDAVDFILRNHRLPNEVFIGAETLSLPDFAATLAGSVLAPGGDVRVLHGHVEFDRYFATDPSKPFQWPIHPAAFSAPSLLKLGRLQGWTLKPARLLQ